MPDEIYGLTDKGPNIKRLDVILSQMHKQLSEKWGVNTRQDPESLVNHLLTNIADRVAELWEFGEEVYFSQYPSMAEGRSLDNAAQYGGITREVAAKSYYRILCTGTDGTVIPANTLIATDTNPATQLRNTNDAAISSRNFSIAKIVIAEPNSTSSLSVMINGISRAYVPQSGDDDEDKLRGLAEALSDPLDIQLGGDFDVSYEDDAVVIKAKNLVSSNVLVLSSNLTTSSVGSVVLFATLEDGDIQIPDGVITNIVKAVSGLESVTNVGGYVAGRLLETDTEMRQSYIDKIYKRSSSMVESIRSAILDNCQGVETCSVYENDTNEWDDWGRPPHSVEVVVDGSFVESELAQQIFETKAGGISTYGSHAVVVPGLYGEDITIRYNTPELIYTRFNVHVTFDPDTNPPLNYVDLIKGVILDWMNNLSAGDDVVSQRFIPQLYNKVSGIDYFDVTLYASNDPDEETDSSEFTDRVATLTPRQKAVTSSAMIEVTFDA